MKERIVLILIGILIAIIFAVIVTGIYYGGFMHSRYWKTTIRKTSFITANLIRNTINLNWNSIIKDKFHKLKEVFKYLRGKISITVIYKNRVVFTNKVSRYKLGRLFKPVKIDASGGTIEVKIATYSPPKWNKVFFGWLKRPGKLFSKKYDFISFPFFVILAIIMLCMLAFTMYYKARHEKGILNDLIKEFTDEQE